MKANEVFISMGYNLSGFGRENAITMVPLCDGWRTVLELLKNFKSFTVCPIRHV